MTCPLGGVAVSDVSCPGVCRAASPVSPVLRVPGRPRGDGHLRAVTRRFAPNVATIRPVVSLYSVNLRLPGSPSSNFRGLAVGKRLRGSATVGELPVTRGVRPACRSLACAMCCVRASPQPPPGGTGQLPVLTATPLAEVVEPSADSLLPRDARVGVRGKSGRLLRPVGSCFPGTQLSRKIGHGVTSLTRGQVVSPPSAAIRRVTLLPFE